MRAVLSALVLCVSLACGSGPQGSPAATDQLTTAVSDLHEGQIVDGVPCMRDDLPAQHFHVHLEVLLDGKPIVVPAGIGVGRPWGANPDGELLCLDPHS